MTPSRSPADPGEEPVRHRDRRARRGAGGLCPGDESQAERPALLQPGVKPEYLRAAECCVQR
jgi:hypothetical protein